MNDLTVFLKNLTTQPGIYRMIDAAENVLYVGKALNLKKRVKSYFTRQNQGAKTLSLVSQIARIEVTITGSETEALLLESNLIKSLRPKYNVLMRDDKSYPYIYVSEHDFPRIEVIRSKKKPSRGLYFGPYPSTTAVRDALNIIQKIFQIRNCRDSYFAARSRPCLQYQIKRCTAPCTQYISAENYKENLTGAIKFLQGKCHLILEELEQKMQSAVNRLAFEEAALLRDQIKSLRVVQEEQSITRLRGDADVIALHVQPGFACIQCLTIRQGEILGSQRFFPLVPSVDLGLSEQELIQQVFESFVNFYYFSAPDRIPHEIILANTALAKDVIEPLLRKMSGRACKMMIMPKGIKNQWSKLAKENLTIAINEYTASHVALSTRYQSLQKLLNVENITHMECFDISHTQGQATIASCVVFDKQGPHKKEYRHFNIEGITPGDDYAAMEQVLIRRCKYFLQTNKFPQLLIIDGGIGQITVAKKVLQSLGIINIKLLGIAKGADRKAGWERLILADEEREITLSSDSPALHLLQHIRNEAHRFAITAHRKKRHKSALKSSLESVEGIGSKRRHALLQRFGGIRDLANASVEEIAKVPGIHKELAVRVYQHFHLSE